MASDEHVDVMPSATKTYSHFLTLIKYALPPIILVVVLVVWLIS